MKSIRLEKILALIPLQTELIFDIGTDHGYLAIKAIKDRKVQQVYAIDNRVEPLNSAKRNILRAGLNEKIITQISDGLSFVEDLTTKTLAICVIAGLGSQTIQQILTKDSEKIESYILCSNTNPWQIREWANDNHHLVTYETFFFENNHPYWLLKIEKQKKFKAIDNIFFGDFSWYKENYDYRSYLEKSLTRFQKLIQKIGKTDQSIQIEQNIKSIEGYLKLWN